MQLFVPGRLCLFGEHSDWAGGYRRINPELGKGYALISGIDRGLYAAVRPHPTHFIVRATGNRGESLGTLQLPMTADSLLAEARSGGFFSYAAGVAYQILQRYRVGGIDLNNHRSTLPIQKGLSSSAALCVLVARAFNRTYNLQLSVREEMEFAYLGERTTPSQCGRMDQACAYGQQPVIMIFDGEATEIVKLSLWQPLYLVLVDLGGAKNTQEILAALNQAYPIARNRRQKDVQYYLGEVSAEITQAAAIALSQGDPQHLGQLMKQAQAAFDRYLIPACPSQLTAPLLHTFLDHPLLQPYIWGGKGVGSQGDGTAQLLAKDRIAQQEAIAVIEQDFPQMRALGLVLAPPT